MIRGRREHFRREHYEAHAGVSPTKLAELVVHCLELVATLASRGVPFRFKGGNSLLVLLEDPQRFSIDVDVVTTLGRDALTEEVGATTEESDVFTRWESRAPRTKPWLPLISYKIFFDSCFEASEPAYVMLDAVLEPPPYPGTRRLVRCGSLYESEVEVEVPTISGLIGDKLLTIGPSTLGIPIGKNKAAQRLKHVFDVATLSRRDWDADAVRQSLRATKAQEEAIQRRTHPWHEVLADTRRFCELPLAYAEPPALEATADPYLAEITSGFVEFRQHLFRAAYRWELFKDDCRRVLEILDTVGEP
ncbi:MAG: nucleotidyl transferase AbiEii/AbiGii toxin family protein [Polyangiaceae bacterium]|nr:nucleotidyl transferase AbiEii/AbiGii toxin family protein [Polyangiaceae bacterium]